MSISVIIASWNNADRLARTVRAVLSCTIPDDVTKCELVVVNNNSTDHTDRVLGNLAENEPRLVRIFEPIQGLSAARNAGIKAAKGDLLIFADDDITPCAGWITAYWHAYRNNDQPAFFGGPIESDFEGQAPDAELLPYAPASVKGLDLGASRRELTTKEHFLAANWSLPLSAALAVGGFDESLGLKANSSTISGEEDDLQARLREQGFRAIYLPETRVAHYVPSSKVNLAHIASRMEMYGAKVGRKLALSYEGPRIGKSPRFLFRQIWSARAASYLWKFLSRRNYYKKYLRYRHLCGVRRAFTNSTSEGLET